MNKLMFAVPCAVLILIGGTMFAQERPTESRNGKEHRKLQSGAALGDGSVHSSKTGLGTQSAASNLKPGGNPQIHRGWGQEKTRSTVASTKGNKGARPKSKHPGGAN